MRLRFELRHWFAWVAEPWRSPSVVVPLVLAFALPAFLLATAHRFEAAAADSVTERIVDEVPPDGLGITVQANGPLDADGVNGLDTSLTDRLSEIPNLDDPVLARYTTGGTAMVDRGSLGREQLQTPPRFFSRPGTLESLDIVEASAGPSPNGVHVSETFAAQAELTIGSRLDVVTDSASVSVTVHGIYRDLWPEPPAPWDVLPYTLAPRFDPSTRGPSFELLIVDPEFLLDQGLSGFLLWTAQPTPAPSTIADLEAMVEDYEAVSEDLVRDPQLVEAARGFTGVGGGEPFVTTRLDEALDRTRAALQSIESPLAAAQSAGVTLGLLAVAANAAFLAVRQRRAWRVLVSSGDVPIRLFGMAAGRALVPALLGGLVGVFAAGAITSVLVPDAGSGFASIRSAPIVAAIAGSLALFASVTSLVALSLADQRRERPLRLGGLLLVPLVALAIAGWVQVGSESFLRSISPIVIFTPIPVLAATAGVATAGLRRLLSATRLRSINDRPALLLGLRRAASSSAAGATIAGALAVSVGLFVFALAMDQTRETSIAAKSLTRTGAESSATLVTPIPPGEVPDRTTVAARTTAFITPGEEVVGIIAIDAETFADVVDLPRTFGDLTPAEIVTRLERTASEVPAISLTSRPVPASAVFGVRSRLEYTLVGSVDSAPLAPATRPMLLMRADALEQASLEAFSATFAEEFDRAPTEQEIAELHEPALASYRLTLLSDLPAPELERLADLEGLAAWEFTDRSDIRNAPEEQVVRWSFRYLRLVAAVSLVVTLLSVWLFARQRTRGRFEADRVGRILGIDRATSMRAAAVEYTVLATVALVPAVIAAVAVSSRIAPVFERGPVPPRLELDLPVAQTALLTAAGFVAVLAIGVGTERFSKGSGST